MEKRRRWFTMLILPLLCAGACWGSPGKPQGRVAATPSRDSRQSTESSPASAAESSSSPAGATTPLSGAGKLTRGPSGGGRSYLLPAFECTGFADTNPGGAPGQSQLQTQTSYVGNIVLQRVRRRSQLNLNYAGGGFFYSRGIESRFNRPIANGTFHTLALTQTMDGRRWRLLVDEKLSYLPQSALGFGGYTGLDSFGGGRGAALLANAPVLNPTLSADQTIFTGDARRLSNLALVQIEYHPGQRSAITAVGMYGNLHFLDSGFINNNYWALRSGYNYSVTRRDVVAVTYMHQVFRFAARNGEILNRGFQLAYGRRLTGRLSLELSGGPVVSRIALPLRGSLTRSFWSMYNSLQYGAEKVNAEISFSRYATGGSGVLVGAESDLASLSLGRPLWRRAYGSLIFDYAHNQSLTQLNPLQGRSKYEMWQGRFTLSRELGRRISIYSSYSIAQQNSNDRLCIGNKCGTTFLRHLGAIGFNWHGRPIGLN